MQEHPAINLREEFWSAITHGLGAIAALAGSIMLITLAALYGDAWQVVGASVYAVSLVLLFTASTLYHSINHHEIKRKLKTFDHCAIFLLIAGTYTPFTLIALRGSWGWALFGVIWALAVAGVVFKLFFTGRYERTSLTIYIAMGWLVVFAAVPLVRALPVSTLLLLLGGGLAYTLGTLFYASKRIPFAHTIWHVFVLVGGICHFAAVYSHVVPQVAS